MYYSILMEFHQEAELEFIEHEPCTTATAGNEKYNALHMYIERLAMLILSSQLMLLTLTSGGIWL